MSKQINDIELMEIAESITHEMGEDDAAPIQVALAAMRSAQTAYLDSMTILGHAIAENLQIRVTSDADDWAEGEPLMGFGPAELGQAMPDVLTDYDQGGEWAGDEDDELADGECDQCFRSHVQVARTNEAGETICIDCDDDCE